MEDEAILLHRPMTDGDDGSAAPNWVVWRALSNVLAQRLMLLTLLTSTLIAIITTLIQLYFNYLNDRAALDGSVDAVEASVLPSLRESLWLLDDTLVQTQLDGVLQTNGVVYVGVEHDVISYSAGDETAAFARVDEYPLLYQSAGVTHDLGTLTLRVSYSDIRQRLVQLGLVILATNFLKSVAVGSVILFIFQSLVGRHLSSMARYVDDYDQALPPEPLRLDRRRRNGSAPDDLDRLQEAINHWTSANQAYLSKLKDAHQEQAEFTYAISHDVKAPLNTMQMLIAELQEETQLDGVGRQIVSDMNLSNVRMQNLVTGLLGYSSTLSERHEFESVDLNDILNTVIQDLSADITVSGADVRCAPLPRVTGDPVQLRMLFQNLLSNAIKFRRPQVAPVVTITAQSDGAAHLIEVADNGIGIPKARRNGVFGLFSRLHAHSDFEGSGLGLAICKRAVSNHGGTIDIRPGDPAGTVFVIRLLA